MALLGPSAPLRLSNRAVRLLFLERHALADDPSRRLTKSELQSLIERLGFVQVDSINTVARAHDLILFSRRTVNPAQGGNVEGGPSGYRQHFLQNRDGLFEIRVSSMCSGQTMESKDKIRIDVQGQISFASRVIN